MAIELLQVDAFTDRPFRGNPAGVCLLPAGDWPDDAWLAAVAAEVNAAETSFLRPAGTGTWDLRWFTPTVEVDLCGHATLAAAHALRTHWDEDGDRLAFATRSGELAVSAAGDGRLVLDLPADPPAPTAPRPDLEAALGLEGARVEHLASRRFDVVVVPDAATVDALAPDLAAVAAACPHAALVTAPGAAGFDVASRVFGPSVGIPEDPVTGSAHAVVAPLWSARLGRSPLRCTQRSARGGELEAEVRDGRVRLTAHAVTTVVGHLADAAGPPPR